MFSLCFNCFDIKSTTYSFYLLSPQQEEAARLEKEKADKARKARKEYKKWLRMSKLHKYKSRVSVYVWCLCMRAVNDMCCCAVSLEQY